MKTHLNAVKTAFYALGLGMVVTAHAALNAPNDQMSTITNGWFVMGDSNDGNSAGNARKHQVYVNGFSMDKNLITLANWKLVYNWAVAGNYTFSTVGTAFTGSDQPVQSVNWYDVVKWCNARSQMDGLRPCYYTDSAKQTLYTQGNINLTPACVDWSANGYRLPTEAEWEYAARGGTNGQRFPWGMTIKHTLATYKSPMILTLPWDLGPISIIPTGTTAVGSHRSPNGYGLNDMAGNLGEWCWDGYSAAYYATSPTNNPLGANASARVVRGGHWNQFADGLRCATRESDSPALTANYIGFRCVSSTNNSNGGSTGNQPQSIWFTDGNTVLAPGSNLQPGSGLFALADSGQTVTLAVSNSIGTIDGTGTNLNIAIPQITVLAHVNGNATYAPASSNVTFTVMFTNSVRPALVVANGKITAASLSQALGSPSNIVDQQGLNSVLAHYWLQSPPWITNATFPGGTNFCFNITNFAFTVQSSTNLTSWQNFGGHARVVFDDTNAPGAPNRYYRLVGSTNY